MLVRFDCPSCGRSHSFDSPETTVHLTCGTTGVPLRLRVTSSGEVKASIVREGQAVASEDEADE